MKINDFKGKKVLVMGLGLHGGGVGSAEWFAKHGAKVTVTDLKTRKALAPSIAKLKHWNIRYVLGGHRAKDFRECDIVIQNPGVPRESEFLNIAERSGARLANDMSVFFEYSSAPSIGITGTRGKSTTTALAASIFKRWKPETFVGGNIRTSALSFLDRVKPSTPVILELSSWQLEGLARVRKSPHIALVTNISTDHLNRYKDLNDYIAAKKNIFLFQNSQDVVILNRDNTYTKAMGKEARGRRFWFSKKFFSEENGVFTRGEKIIFRENGKERVIMAIKDIPIEGEHNLENVLGAIAIACVSGVSVEHIRAGVKNFRGLSGRLEFVRELRGVKFINDTTATSPEGARVALRTFGNAKKKNIILIAGGTDKNLDFRDMAKEIKRFAKTLVLLPGTGTDKLQKKLDTFKFSKNSRMSARDMNEAVRLAFAAAKKGDIVLLSPGAASFGLFLHEFDRGDIYVEAVKRLT